MFEKTKKFCDSLLDMGVPGFDLAVFKGGECILRHFNGYSDLENKVKMNGKERYNIYSCSKAHADSPLLSACFLFTCCFFGWGGAGVIFFGGGGDSFCREWVLWWR